MCCTLGGWRTLLRTSGGDNTVPTTTQKKTYPERFLVLHTGAVVAPARRDGSTRTRLRRLQRPQWRAVYGSHDGLGVKVTALADARMEHLDRVH